MVKKKVKSKIKKVSKWHAVPLKGSFMVTAILGILLSYYYVYPISFNFGIVSMLFFTIMFIASLVSMSKAPINGKI
ncbi:hypothetical protein GOV03_04970 [Candidatus Woesearchaeota archaeon]|nr:hypothetical protein [Candidatus Woesearchaeota archaeon]